MKEAFNFPLKLHQLLDVEDPEIICWCPNGRGFKVLDTDRFRDLTLTKYYRHTKLTSFQRQLNLYGFKKVIHGEDSGSYYHPLFVRGRRDLIKDFKRSAIKTSATEYEMSVFQPRTASREYGTRLQSMLKEAPPSPASDDLSPKKPAQQAYSRRNLFNQMDDCRELQFKSNFHQTAYPWRQILGDPNSTEQPEMRLLSDPQAELDQSQLREYAQAEVIKDNHFDFDFFFDQLKDSTALPLFDEAPQELLSDEELMLLLEC